MIAIAFVSQIIILKKKPSVFIRKSDNSKQ